MREHLRRSKAAPRRTEKPAPARCAFGNLIAIPQLTRLSTEHGTDTCGEPSRTMRSVLIPVADGVKRLLDARFAHYQEHPETAKTWDELKRSLGKTE